MKISWNNWLEIYITPPIYNYIICLFECYTNVIRVIFRKKNVIFITDFEI